MALAAPVVVGMKKTWKVLVPPGATVGGVGKEGGEKRKTLSPVRIKPLSVRSAVPVLVMVTVCAALVVPTSTLPKLRLVGVTPIPGATPVPAKATVTGPALLAILTVPVAAPAVVGAKLT